VSGFDFHFGAPVRCHDGRLIGNLERLIVEKEGLDPHSIVVKEDDGFSGRRFAPGAWYFHDELIVPVKSVARAGRDGVELTVSATDARHLVPYLSYRYRAADRAQVGRMFVALASGGPYTPNVEEIANKKPDELEVSADENVMLGHGGHKLGQVRDVVIQDGEFIGVVIRPSGFFAKDVLVPVRFLERSDDMALFVDLSEDDIKKLRPPDS
jgi:hypothetical protein